MSCFVSISWLLNCSSRCGNMYNICNCYFGYSKNSVFTSLTCFHYSTYISVSSAVSSCARGPGFKSRPGYVIGSKNRQICVCSAAPVTMQFELVKLTCLPTTLAWLGEPYTTAGGGSVIEDHLRLPSIQTTPNPLLLLTFLVFSRQICRNKNPGSVIPGGVRRSLRSELWMLTSHYQKNVINIY